MSDTTAGESDTRVTADTFDVDLAAMSWGAIIIGLLIAVSALLQLGVDRVGASIVLGISLAWVLSGLLVILRARTGRECVWLTLAIANGVLGGAAFIAVTLLLPSPYIVLALLAAVSCACASFFARRIILRRRADKLADS